MLLPLTVPPYVRTRMAARWEFPMSEIVLQPCRVNALHLDAARKRAERVCRLSVMTWCANLVRRITLLTNIRIIS
jgi:hypothetical protein